jgi:hypothetical protein
MNSHSQPSSTQQPPVDAENVAPVANPPMNYQCPSEGWLRNPAWIGTCITVTWVLTLELLITCSQTVGSTRPVIIIPRSI